MTAKQKKVKFAGFPDEFEADDIRALMKWLDGNTSPRAQRALARMLRGNMEIRLRLTIADAIDPDSLGTHELILKRGRGRPRKVSQQEVAVYVWRQMQTGAGFEAAVKKTMDDFHLSHGTVTSAWNKRPPHLKSSLKRRA
jgi:hypothetical protein